VDQVVSDVDAGARALEAAGVGYVALMDLAARALKMARPVPVSYQAANLDTRLGQRTAEAPADEAGGPGYQCP
jgi:hypothetical protein